MNATQLTNRTESDNALIEALKAEVEALRRELEAVTAEKDAAVNALAQLTDERAA